MSDPWTEFQPADPWAEFAPKKGDKYQQAAKEDLARQDKLGVGGYGAGDSVLNGLTLGAAGTILAGMETPVEMAKHGTLDPTEGYAYAKARQDAMRDRYRDEHPVVDALGNAGGGILTGAGLAHNGLTLVKAGQGIGARAAAMAGEGAAYGGLTGFNEGDGAEGRLTGAARGAALGGVIGGSLPVVGAGLKAAAAPLISNVAARMDPEGAAKARLVRALSESGASSDEVAQKVSDAAASGQGAYTLADALGNPGQNLLSTVARAPGEGRTAVTNFLEARQAGQAGRVGSAIDEALGVNGTKQQAIAELFRQGDEASRPLYEKAMQVGPVWDDRIQQFLDDPVMKQGLATGVKIQRLNALARGEKFNPHDFAITDFDAAGDPIFAAVPNMRTLQAGKIGLDKMVEEHTDPVTGRMTQMGAAINNVRKAFLTKLNDYNPAYAEANAAYAGPARAREAIADGAEMATRGRAADNLEAFGKLAPLEQQGARIGYADALNQQIERGAQGVNAARRFTSDKAQAELPALSLFNGPYRPGQADTLSQRLGREMDMFETRRIATGGSRTADNLANEDAAGIDPRIFWNALHGNFGKAAANAIHASGNAMTGNTPAVRSHLAELLLQGGADGNIAPMLGALQSELASRQALAAALSRGLVTGVGNEAGQKR